MKEENLAPTMPFRMNSERRKVPGLVILWIIQTPQRSEVSAFPQI